MPSSGVTERLSDHLVLSKRSVSNWALGMIRLMLLSLVAAGLMYVAYTSLLTREFEFSDSPTKRAEPLQFTQDTPWTEIDPAAQNSPHAIVPDQDLSTTAALEALPSPIDVEKDPSIANAQATSATEQTEHIKITSPASIREGPSTSTAIIGIAKQGVEAQVVSRQSEWVQIIDAASKKTGWVESSFLESNSQPGSQALSKQEIEAALDARDEADSSAPETSKPSVGPRKSKKHGSRHNHHRRGYSFRFLFRRAW
jgi:uncharacterized protein YraI